MKKQITILLAILVNVIVLAEFEVPHIIVYGTAETKVTPDELHWNVSINTKGKQVDLLASEHLREVESLLQYLQAKGVADEDVQTSRMQLNENWEYRNQSRLKAGYYAYTQIQFKTTDFEEYIRIWTELAKFSNIAIDNVAYGVSNLIELQKKTRIEAVLAAKKKAQELASVLEAGLVEPLLLEEITTGTDTSGHQQSLSVAGARMEQARGGVSPGTESIMMRVKVIYRIAGS
jgi:uncharacterized protein YggE